MVKPIRWSLRPKLHYLFVHPVLEMVQTTVGNLIVDVKVSLLEWQHLFFLLEEHDTVP